MINRLDYHDMERTSIRDRHVSDRQEMLSEEVTREIEYMRREQMLMQREMRLLERENQLLRGVSRNNMNAVSEKQNIALELYVNYLMTSAKRRVCFGIGRNYIGIRSPTIDFDISFR